MILFRHIECTTEPKFRFRNHFSINLPSVGTDRMCEWIQNIRRRYVCIRSIEYFFIIFFSTKLRTLKPNSHLFRILFFLSLFFCIFIYGYRLDLFENTWLFCRRHFFSLLIFFAAQKSQTIHSQLKTKNGKIEKKKNIFINLDVKNFWPKLQKNQRRQDTKNRRKKIKSSIIYLLMHWYSIRFKYKIKIAKIGLFSFRLFFFKKRFLFSVFADGVYGISFRSQKFICSF